MIVVRSIDEVRAGVAVARQSGATIGFVPTMGFLHEGHLALVDRARREGATWIAASIFVNPTQFGPDDDLDRYPRDETRDRRLLESRGVDLLFAPLNSREIYPPGHATTITMGGVAEPLEGERRPGHFAGVATIVAKLLNIVQPDLAVFGKKDRQQCAVVKRMVADLAIPVRIALGETVREPDGLAMSSRNSYLSPGQRSSALALHRALEAGRRALVSGRRDVEAIEAAMRDAAADPGIEIDYLRLVDPETFLGPLDFARDLLLTGAIRVGATRLIDNIEIRREKESE